MMYWFTGYIFDTFNELIQMFFARKDLPSITAVLLTSAYRSRGVRPQDRGLVAPARHPPAPCPPSLPSLGRMNLTHILWPPSVHGGGVLSFTRILIKRRIILNVPGFPLVSTGQPAGQATGDEGQWERRPPTLRAVGAHTRGERVGDTHP